MNTSLVLLLGGRYPGEIPCGSITMVLPSPYNVRSGMVDGKAVDAGCPFIGDRHCAVTPAYERPVPTGSTSVMRGGVLGGQNPRYWG